MTKPLFKFKRRPKFFLILPEFKLRLRSRKLDEKFRKEKPLQEKLSEALIRIDQLEKDKFKLLKVLDSYDGDHGAEHWEDAIASSSWNDQRIRVLEEFGIGPT